ncbi:MAG: heavy metal sensor histidine kinase [Bryobacteraceae bacterium]
MPNLSAITNSLRFRLTLSYAICFALFLGLVGFLIQRTLAVRLGALTERVVAEEWLGLKGYLRVTGTEVYWVHDRDDPEQVAFVERIERMLLVADADGNVLKASDRYRALGVDSPQEIAASIRGEGSNWKIKTGRSGDHYLVRSGTVLSADSSRTPYYVAIGTDITSNALLVRRFVQTYAIAVPVVIAIGCVMGWMLTGRALEPVRSVARTAQSISGSNLSLRIPSHGTNDELDSMITTFNGMIERLEANFQQMKQFSSNVSHELRTPLTALRGHLEVALLSAQNEEQLRDTIINSLGDIERLGQLVRALLQLSQAESGQLVLQKTRVDMVEPLGEILERFRLAAEEAGIRLSGELPEQCLADIDGVQFDRMVSNLLSNAIRFTPPGGEIKVRLRSSGTLATLTVDDTGRGIPSEHLPHIFERFYRAGSQEWPADRGLGLGLSFVQWIATAHGGSVEVSSEVGYGTRFSVHLPLVEPSLSLSQTLQV